MDHTAKLFISGYEMGNNKRGIKEGEKTKGKGECWPLKSSGIVVLFLFAFEGEMVESEATVSANITIIQYKYILFHPFLFILLGFTLFENCAFVGFVTSINPD